MEQPSSDCNSRGDGLGSMVEQHLSRMQESFLWAAAQRGREQEVRGLLDLGADVNWVNASAGDETPLLAACRNAHTGVAAALLSHPAIDVNMASASGMSAIHYAARAGDVRLLSMLLRVESCDATSADNTGRTPLEHADELGHQRAGQLLRRFVRQHAGRAQPSRSPTHPSERQRSTTPQQRQQQAASAVPATATAQHADRRSRGPRSTEAERPAAQQQQRQQRAAPRPAPPAAAGAQPGAARAGIDSSEADLTASVLEQRLLEAQAEEIRAQLRREAERTTPRARREGRAGGGAGAGDTRPVADGRATVADAELDLEDEDAVSLELRRVEAVRQAAADLRAQTRRASNDSTAGEREYAAWEQLLMSQFTPRPHAGAAAGAQQAEDTQARQRHARGLGVTAQLRQQPATSEELAAVKGELHRALATLHETADNLQRANKALAAQRTESEKLRRQLTRLRLEPEALEWMTADDLTEVQRELREFTRRAARRAEQLAAQGPAPHEFSCPITSAIMQDPVIARDGHTYERDAIERWFATHPLPDTRSPMTNELLASHDLLPNVTLHKMITDFQSRLNVDVNALL